MTIPNESLIARFAILAAVLLPVVVLSCMTSQTVEYNPVFNVRCEYVFLNTAEEDSDRIASVVERYRDRNSEMYMEVGLDSIYCEFYISSLENIELMNNELKYLPQLRQPGYQQGLSGGLTQELEFSQKEFVVRATYETARLEAGLQMVLKFTITPGAQLFYAVEGGYEEEVPDLFVSEDGQVELPVSVEEGQRFVYARTLVGEVVRCIRVYIYTGETEDITLQEYLQFVRQ